MGDTTGRAELKWRRKGGRAVAEAGAIQCRVEDDGAYAIRWLSGAWEHGRAADAAAARGICAQAAWAGRLERSVEDRMLEERRREAAARAAIPTEHRRWAAMVAKVFVMVTHDGRSREWVLGQLPGGAARQLFERLSADVEVMASLTADTREGALRRVEEVLLRNLARKEE
jgi:hypothetical protein